jgi:hypothetical protein
MQMKRYFVEIILGIVLLIVFFGVSTWQSSGELSRQEVDRYVGILEKSVPPEFEGRREFITRMREWGESDNGQPVYMLNLMRFFDQVKPYPGVPASMKPMDANAHYEDVAVPMLLNSGSYPILGGNTTRISSGQKKSNLIVFEPELDNWDRVLVVRYSGRRAFFDLVTNPEYLKVMPYKMASLKVLLTPVSGDLVIPDIRWIVGGICLVTFLLIGWVRAARHCK